MSHHAAVLDGAARLLHAHEFGVYRADGHFAKTERGIVISAFPDDPPEVVALTLYSPEWTRLGAGAARRLSAASIQIKYRLNAHPLAGVEYFDRLGDLLDGKALELGELRAHGEYISYTPLGMTHAGAWVFSTNWRISSLQTL